jgi:sec-independent protein translocase protein TatA
MIENILTPTHLLIVLAIALLVLGPKRLPAAGRGLGEAMRGFKEALTSCERPEANSIERPEEATRSTQ